MSLTLTKEKYLPVQKETEIDLPYGYCRNNPPELSLLRAPDTCTVFLVTTSGHSIQL